MGPRSRLAGKVGKFKKKSELGQRVIDMNYPTLSNQLSGLVVDLFPIMWEGVGAIPTSWCFLPQGHLMTLCVKQIFFTSGFHSTKFEFIFGPNLHDKQ